MAIRIMPSPAISRTGKLKRRCVDGRLVPSIVQPHHHQLPGPGKPPPPRGETDSGAAVHRERPSGNSTTRHSIAHYLRARCTQTRCQDGAGGNTLWRSAADTLSSLRCPSPRALRASDILQATRPPLATHPAAPKDKSDETHARRSESHHAG